MHKSTCPFLRPHRKPLRGVLRIQNKVTPPESLHASPGVFFPLEKSRLKGRL
nr:MAG TPA: hypothetical protein [Caudoviricetes sp.]